MSREQFDFNYMYSAIDLLDIFELPVYVRKGTWTRDFRFKITSVTDRVRGESYKGGRLYDSDRTYKKSELFYVCEDQDIIFKNDATDDDGEVENFTPFVTKLNVLKQGEWKAAVFIKFDWKQGKRVIWVKCEGKESFYAFPSKFIAFTKEEQKSKTLVFKTKFDSINPREVDISVCDKYPIAKPAQEDEEIELSVEKEYHGLVNTYLLDYVETKREAFDEVRELRSKAFTETQEANREAREIGAYVYNSHYGEAERLNQRADAIETKTFDAINNAQRIRRTPYFARLDFGPSKRNVHTVYIGDDNVSDGLVVDWRNSSIGKLFYFTDDIKTSSSAVIPLKRYVTISDCVFRGYRDEINEYVEGFLSSLDGESLQKSTDDLFNKLLEESRSEQDVHDIIKTIRSNQYDIIASDFDKNIIVNGCAGSGKTMILYHRLSYMAYNDMNRFDPKRCYVVTPTARYESINDKLFEKLKLQDIRNCTFETYLRNLISCYCVENSVFDSIVFSMDAIIDDSDLNSKYYDSKRFDAFVEKIEEIKEDTRDFFIWYTKRINKYLEACDFDPIAEIDMLLGKNTPLVLNYAKNPKIDAARKNSIFTTADWDTLIDAASSRKNDIADKLKKYELPLKNVLSVYRSDPDRIIAFYNDSVTNFENFLLLQILEKQILILREFYKAPDDDSKIYLALCEYAMQQIKSQDSNLDKTTTYRFELLYYLKALTDKFYTLTDERTVVFIDEFQNYSKFELEAITDVFGEAVYNLYGDYSQKMLGCGANEEEISDLFSPYRYTIPENYRNAKEITEFINYELGMDMFPIGVHGNVGFDTIKNCKFDIKGRTALIIDDQIEKVVELLKKSKIKINRAYQNNKIDAEKLNILTVADAKGLEFETVYVYMPQNNKTADRDIERNKRYVAYTRALDSLFVLSGNLDSV